MPRARVPDRAAAKVALPLPHATSSTSQVTVCTDDPGYDVDLAIEADTGQMQRWLVGLVPFRDLIANGHARLLGPSRLARAFPTWFDTSYFAEGLRRAGQHDRPQAVPA
jgi:hypothetical protein